VYADTSVFGGLFDDVFKTPTRVFFEQIRQGRFSLALSALVADEIENAPARVQSLFAEIADISEMSDIPLPAIRLQTAYLKAGIVGEGSMADALHVALATYLKCQAIVSWNFRHIVHLQKIRLYNDVNRANGYAEIAIHSPQEVILYEDESL
jgi:predicted nucleic acid-binding protein